MSKRRWTAEEIAYLEETWGTVNTRYICSKLGRSFSGLVQKAWQLGLGPAGGNGYLLTIMQVADGMGVSTSSVKRWGRQGLRIQRKRLKKEKVSLLIDPQDLWDYLYEHRHEVNLAKMEPLVFGEEPDWLAAERKRWGTKGTKRSWEDWTEYEIGKLRRALERGDTAETLAVELGRTPHAVLNKARAEGVVLSSRPGRRAWTEEEMRLVEEMALAGAGPAEVAAALGRSWTSVAGKLNGTHGVTGLPALARKLRGGQGNGSEKNTHKGRGRRVAAADGSNGEKLVGG